MLRAWRLSVCLSVTLVDCGHIVQQKEKKGTWQDRLVSWLVEYRSRFWTGSTNMALLYSTLAITPCESRPGSWCPCYSDVYWETPLAARGTGYRKYEVLHFGGIQRLACRAISASSELSWIYLDSQRMVDETPMSYGYICVLTEWPNKSTRPENRLTRRRHEDTKDEHYSRPTKKKEISRNWIITYPTHTQTPRNCTHGQWCTQVHDLRNFPTNL